MTEATHTVLDLTDIDFSGNTSGVFEGSISECQDFISQQGSGIGYDIVPVLKQPLND